MSRGADMLAELKRLCWFELVDGWIWVWIWIEVEALESYKYFGYSIVAN